MLSAKQEDFMDEYETINLDATPGGIAVLTLDRPDRHNALNALVIEETIPGMKTSRTPTSWRRCCVDLLRCRR